MKNKNKIPNLSIYKNVYGFQIYPFSYTKNFNTKKECIKQKTTTCKKPKKKTKEKIKSKQAIKYI